MAKDAQQHQERCEPCASAQLAAIRNGFGCPEGILHARNRSPSSCALQTSTQRFEELRAIANRKLDLLHRARAAPHLDAGWCAAEPAIAICRPPVRVHADVDDAVRPQVGSRRRRDCRSCAVAAGAGERPVCRGAACGCGCRCKGRLQMNQSLKNCQLDAWQQADEAHAGSAQELGDAHASQAKEDALNALKPSE